VEIPTRPMLKPWYRVLIGPGRILLEFRGTLAALEGGATERLVPALLTLLDGTRTIDEIVAELGEAVERATRLALEALANAGALTEGPPLPASVPRPVTEAAAFIAAASPSGSGPAQVLDRLAESRVGVLGDPALGAEVAGLLRDCGVGSADRIDHARPCALPELDLVLAIDAASEHLRELNRAALSSGVTWLPAASFDGVAAWIGPLVVPGETCCWRCFHLRRASTTGYATEFEELEDVRPARFCPPPLAATISGLTATTALRWLALRDPRLPGTALALESWPRFTLSEHVVYRVPRCTECSGLSVQAAPSPWAEEEAA
jgi:bacteriocin biosynthesis cyclodehydratase domain-containing protein